MSKATKAKLAAALAEWRTNLTPEAKAELAERTCEKQRRRWLNLSERERRDRLAGVRAWQREQRKAKRDAARPEAKAPAKVGPKAEEPTPAETKPVGRRASRRSHKAVES